MQNRIKISKRKTCTKVDNDWEETVSNYKAIALSDYFTDTVVNKIYFSPECLKNIETWVNTSIEEFHIIPEIGGILLGKYRRQEDCIELRIDAFAPIKEVQAQSSTSLVVGKGFAQAILEVDEKTKDLLVLGWFHTHPGHGPFLSSTDLNQTQIFFPHDYQIAIVLDSLTDKFDTGCFSRKSDGRMNNAKNQKDWIRWKQLL